MRRGTGRRERLEVRAVERILPRAVLVVPMTAIPPNKALLFGSVMAVVALPPRTNVPKLIVVACPVGRLQRGLTQLNWSVVHFE